MKNNLDSIIEEWEKVLMSDCGNLEITWGDLVDGDIKPLQDFLTKALTEVKQQGFKEAMEKVRGIVSAKENPFRTTTTELDPGAMDGWDVCHITWLDKLKDLDNLDNLDKLTTLLDE